MSDDARTSPERPVSARAEAPGQIAPSGLTDAGTQFDHATSVLEHLELVTECKTLEEIWALHTGKMVEYGFDRLLYGFTRFLNRRDLGNIDDALILSNQPQEYLDHYIRREMYRDAPMINWATEHVGATSWRATQEAYEAGRLSPAETRVVEFNRRHQIVAGYTISFRDISARAKGAIGLCARRGLDQDDVDRIWDLYGRDIHIINVFTHLRIIAMPYTTSRRRLTQRQREVLEWVGDGKTVQDIATILGVTPATVEKHLRLAREALEVETTPHAVVKAMFQNQTYTLRE